jgi:hypothetical protein
VIALAALCAPAAALAGPTVPPAGGATAPAGRAPALGARLVRVGVPSRLPRGATVLGGLAPDATLQVTLTLEPRDPAALAAFATAVSTPGSPLYRHFITVSQFARRFGAAPAQIAAARAALRAEGLAPGPTAADGLSIPLHASTAALERAFATQIERVRLPGGQIGRIATAAPALPAAVAGEVQSVLGVSALAHPAPVGLRVLERWRPGRALQGARQALQEGARSRPGGAIRNPRLSPRAAPQDCPAADSAASGPGYSGYSATQLGQAFGLSALWSLGDLGQGEHVAVYELEGNFPSDITAYQQCFGTSATVNYIPVDGGGGVPSPSNYDGLETELDVENVIAADPQATIDVYQGNQGSAAAPYDTYAAIIGQDRDSVITTSWGLCEPLLSPGEASAESTLFQEAASQGQTVVAASGDSGSEDCYDQNNSTQLAVDDPASQPYVTGVGGTSLSSIDPVAQTMWNGGANGGAGGGGISSLWPMPAYQASAPPSLNVVNQYSSGMPCSAAAGGLCREVPDVSFSADPNHPYVVDYDNRWGAVGGTSGATPYWAGLVALSAQLPAAERGCGGSRLGLLNPLLYRLGGHREEAIFDDITSGNNDMLGFNGGLYPATPGYDMASGLGTFNAETPFALCDRVTLTAAGPYRLIDGAGAAAGTLGAHSSDGQPIVAWSAGGLPPGVSLSAAGRLSGVPARGAAGTYTATVAAADADGSIGSELVTFDVVPSRVGVSLQRGHWKLAAWPVGVALAPGAIVSARDADVRGASFAYAAAGLPPGLTLDPATGYLSGTPGRIGRYAVTISVTDGFGSADTHSIWTVYGRPRAGGRLRGGALSFTLTAGRLEPGGLRGLELLLPARLSFAGAGALRRGLTVRAGRRTLRVWLRRGPHSLQVRLPRGEHRVQVSLAAGAVSRVSRQARLVLDALDAAGSVPVALSLR